jgi:hypothetical protein
MLELSPGIKQMHIGGDEAWTLGDHPDTRRFIEENGKATLILNHLKPIAETLLKRGTRPLLWHDMMIDWEDAALLEAKDIADIVFWGYDEPLEETSNHYNIKHVARFAELGLNLWGAGAYKGGSGPTSVIPDTAKLAENARSWRRTAEKFDFKGLIATGWSRYSQFHPPCDPIFLSLESLFIIGGIFAESLEDETLRAAKLAESLEKRGLTKSLRRLNEVAAEFATAFRQAWDAHDNLKQQYWLEERYFSDVHSHVGKAMLRDFRYFFDKLEKASNEMKSLLEPLADQSDIAQFVDPKIEALRILLKSEEESFSKE